MGLSSLIIALLSLVYSALTLDSSITKHNASNGPSSHNRWDTEMPPTASAESSCKRYISFDVKKNSDSISDSIEGLLLALAVTKRVKGTLVLPLVFRASSDNSISSNNSSTTTPEKIVTDVQQQQLRTSSLTSSYHHIFYNLLGIPKNIPFIDTIKYEGVPKEIKADLLLYNPSLINGYKCNELLLANMNSCGTGENCLFKHGDVIHASVKPILLQSKSNAVDKCNNIKYIKTKGSVITIAWYVRTGQLCTDKCDEAGYVSRVWSFIAPSVIGRQFKNIVLLQQQSSSVNDERSSAKILQTKIDAIVKVLPNSIVIPSMHQSRDDICTMLTSDILVSTGSAFVNAITQFSDYNVPIVLTDYEEGWLSNKVIRKHLTCYIMLYKCPSAYSLSN